MSAVARIYVFRFISGFAPIAQLYSVMFAAQDLSTFEISVLLAAWSISAIVFEVPSGVVADKFNRRWVLFAGQMLSAAAFLVWIAEPTFWPYLIGFVLWGIARAFDSGTFEALVYDELAANGESERYVEVLGRTESAYLASVVAGSAFAALFIYDSYNVLLWASAVAALAGGLCTLALPRATRQAEVEDEDTSFLSVLRRGVSLSLRTPALARAIVVVALAGGVTDIVSEYAPLFANDNSVSPAGVAIVGAIAVLVMALASAYASRLPTAKLPPAGQLLLAGACIIAATYSPTWIAVVLFNLSAVVANTTWILTRAGMQHHISSDVRATTTSVGGFLQEVLNVVGLIVIGVLADHIGRLDAFRWLGVAIVIGAVAAARPTGKAATDAGNV